MSNQTYPKPGDPVKAGQIIGRIRYKRHGAEVLGDKLADALDRWPNEWSGQERDEISRLRTHLYAIADVEG